MLSVLAVGRWLSLLLAIHAGHPHRPLLLRCPSYMPPPSPPCSLSVHCSAACRPPCSLLIHCARPLCPPVITLVSHHPPCSIHGRGQSSITVTTRSSCPLPVTLATLPLTMHHACSPLCSPPRRSSCILCVVLPACCVSALCSPFVERSGVAYSLRRAWQAGTGKRRGVRRAWRDGGQL